MHSTRRGVICVVTNDPVPNGNAVLTYLNDGVGNLSPLPGSPFKTNGTGYTTKHVLPHFGPFDLDQNLMLSADTHRLFVTNGGSDSIASAEMTAIDLKRTAIRISWPSVVTTTNSISSRPERSRRHRSVTAAS